MARFGRVDVNDFIACLIRAEARNRNVDEWLAMGIVSAESGFDPNAKGDAAAGPVVTVAGRTYRPYQDPATGKYWCSLGLLQLNLCGGQGAGHTPADLFDPKRNLSIGMDAIATATIFARSQGWQGERFIREVAHRSGHPGFIDLSDARLTRIFNDTVALITDSSGRIVAWPAFNAAACAGAIPPPPPLGSWTEGPEPQDEASVNAAIFLHLDRIDTLMRRT